MFQIREFEAAFSVFDTQNKFKITDKDWWKGIKRLGIAWDEATAKQCFMEVDDDQGGTMDFTEFSRVMSGPLSPLQEDLRTCIKNFRQAFLLFDLEVCCACCYAH